MIPYNQNKVSAIDFYKEFVTRSLSEGVYHGRRAASPIGVIETISAVPII